MLERFKKEYEIDYAWGKEQGTFFWLPDLADEFLRFFEEQGMQPPAYEKFVDSGCVFGITEEKIYLKRQVNEWEDEQ
jgi:hypothetical protein